MFSFLTYPARVVRKRIDLERRSRMFLAPHLEKMSCTFLRLPRRTLWTDISALFKEKKMFCLSESHSSWHLYSNWLNWWGNQQRPDFYSNGENQIRRSAFIAHQSCAMTAVSRKFPAGRKFAKVAKSAIPGRAMCR